MLLNTITGDFQTPQAQPTQISTVIGGFEVPPSSIVNEYAALTVPAFWRAINYKTMTLAAAPRNIILTNDERYTKTNQPKHTMARILNRKINGTTRPFNFFNVLNHHRFIWGNGYALIQRDEGGNIIGLMNANPEAITPFIFGGQKWFFLSLNNVSNLSGVDMLRLDDGQGGTHSGYILGDTDVIHTMGPSFNGIRGYPLVFLMRQALEVGKNAESHSAKYFRESTLIRGAIEVPGVLTDAQLANLRDSLASFRSTGEKAFSPLLLQANAKLNNSTIPNETSQLIETRKFANIDICRLLNVPPHVVYELDSASRNNIDALNAEVQNAFSLETAELEEELSAKLLTEDEQDSGLSICIDVGAVIHGARPTLVSETVSLVNNGLMRPNYGVARLGLPDLGPDGDTLRMPVAYSQAIASVEAAGLPGESVVEDDDDASGDDVPPTPAAAPAATPATQANDTANDGDYSRVIEPLVIDACERIEAKTAKAFERQTQTRVAKADKADGDKLAAFVVKFAAEQTKYTTEVFAPLAKAADMLGIVIDVNAIATSYGTELTRYAATNEKRNLTEIAKEYTHGQQATILESN